MPAAMRSDPTRFYSQRPGPARSDSARSDSARSESARYAAPPAYRAQPQGRAGDAADEDRTVPRQARNAALARTTVVLDVRQDMYKPWAGSLAAEWFELAVDAAASVALTAARTSFPVHLRTTATAGSAAKAGNWSNVGAVLDWLALVHITPDGSLAGALAEAGRGRSSGELVVVTGTGLDAAERELIHASAGSFDQVLLIQIGPERPEPSAHGKVRTLWARDTESLVLGWVKIVSR